MKVTVCFGDTKVVVPIGDGDLSVRNLAEKAITRFYKSLSKTSNYIQSKNFKIQSLRLAQDGGILDWDDMVADVLDDRELLIAQLLFEDQPIIVPTTDDILINLELPEQPTGAASPLLIGESVMSPGGSSTNHPNTASHSRRHNQVLNDLSYTDAKAVAENAEIFQQSPSSAFVRRGSDPLRTPLAPLTSLNSRPLSQDRLDSSITPHPSKVACSSNGGSTPWPEPPPALLNMSLTGPLTSAAVLESNYFKPIRPRGDSPAMPIGSTNGNPPQTGCMNGVELPSDTTATSAHLASSNEGDDEDVSITSEEEFEEENQIELNSRSTVKPNHCSFPSSSQQSPSKFRNDLQATSLSSVPNPLVHSSNSSSVALIPGTSCYASNLSGMIYSSSQIPTLEEHLAAQRHKLNGSEKGDADSGEFDDDDFDYDDEDDEDGDYPKLKANYRIRSLQEANSSRHPPSQSQGLINWLESHSRSSTLPLPGSSRCYDESSDTFQAPNIYKASSSTSIEAVPDSPQMFQVTLKHADQLGIRVQAFSPSPPHNSTANQESDSLSNPSLNKRDCGLVVQSIGVKDSPTKPDNIHVGDRIVKVNDSSLVGLQFFRARDIFQEAMSQTEVHLVIQPKSSIPQPPPLPPPMGTKIGPPANHSPSSSNKHAAPAPPVANRGKHHPKSSKLPPPEPPVSILQENADSKRMPPPPPKRAPQTGLTRLLNHANSAHKSTLPNVEASSNNSNTNPPATLPPCATTGKPPSIKSAPPPPPPIPPAPTSHSVTSTRQSYSYSSAADNQHESTVISSQPYSRLGDRSESATPPPHDDCCTDSRWCDKTVTIQLKKSSGGLGFSLTTGPSRVGDYNPIYVKKILDNGSALHDGRLRSGDRLLEVDGSDVTWMTQSEVVSILREKPVGSEVDLTISRRPQSPIDSSCCNSDEEGGTTAFNRQAPGNVSKQPIQKLILSVLLDDPWAPSSASPGRSPPSLGISVTGGRDNCAQSCPSGGDHRSSSPPCSVCGTVARDDGVYIKALIEGGAAYRDGRMRVGDQLIEVNGEPLSGLACSEALAKLKKILQQILANGERTVRLVIGRPLLGDNPLPECEPTPGVLSSETHLSESHSNQKKKKKSKTNPDEKDSHKVTSPSPTLGRRIIGSAGKLSSQLKFRKLTRNSSSDKLVTTSEPNSPQQTAVVSTANSKHHNHQTIDTPAPITTASFSFKGKRAPSPPAQAQSHPLHSEKSEKQKGKSGIRMALTSGGRSKSKSNKSAKP